MARPDPSELRGRREERMENGVKNLKGATLFPKTFSNNRNGDAYYRFSNFDIGFPYCIIRQIRILSNLIKAEE